MTAATDALRWQDQGACLGVKDFTDLPPEEQIGHCVGCPVRTDCLQFGLSFRGDLGKGAVGIVYGGLTAEELTSLRRARRKPKPRSTRARPNKCVRGHSLIGAPVGPGGRRSCTHCKDVKRADA